MIFEVRENTEVGRWANRLSDEEKIRLIEIARERISILYGKDSEYYNVSRCWDNKTVVMNLLINVSDSFVLKLLLQYKVAFNTLEKAINACREENTVSSVSG